MKVIQREELVKGIKSLPYGACLAMEDPVWEQIFKALSPVGVVLGDQILHHIIDEMWAHEYEQPSQQEPDTPLRTKSG